MNYLNFYKDFPSRCDDLLNIHETLQSDVVLRSVMKCVDSKEAQDALFLLQERNVTLLLTVTAAALTIPFELLTPDEMAEELDKAKKLPNPRGRKNRDKEHATRSSASHQSEKEVMKDFLKTEFTCMDLYAHDEECWAHYKFPNEELKDEDKPLKYEKLPFVNFPMEKTTFDVIECMRNALAHGNVLTAPSGGQIQYIVFVSGLNSKSKPYECIRVSPKILREFLREWFAFLRSINWKIHMKKKQEG